MAYLPEPFPIESLLRLVLNSPPRTPMLSFASKRVAIERSVHALWIFAVSRLCWELPKPVARYSGVDD